MGSSDSKCYEFRKDEKNKTKEKLKKHKITYNDPQKGVKFDEMHWRSSSMNIASRQCNGDYVEEKTKVLEENDSKLGYSNSDAYTPLRQKATKTTDLHDPRSPTDGIERTPLQLHENDIGSLDDPRSPTYGIDRTPIVLPNVNDAKHHAINLNDPRSPTIELYRTPLNLAPSTDNLRRSVLLTNTLNSSSTSKEIEHAQVLHSSTSSAVANEDEDLGNSFTASLTEPTSCIIDKCSDTAVEGLMAELLNQACDSKNFNIVPEIGEHAMLNVGENLKEVAVEVDKCKDDVRLDASVQTETPIRGKDTCRPIYGRRVKEAFNANAKSSPSTTPKTSDRKRRVKSENANKSIVKDENASGPLGEKKFHKLQEQHHRTRSPLAILGHSNSPEPKRVRPTICETGSLATGPDRKRKASSSRLPRYKSRNAAAKRT